MNAMQQIAADLELCDLGIAFAKGKAKAKFKVHREACFAELKAINERDGLSNMSDDELMAALFD